MCIPSATSRERPAAGHPGVVWRRRSGPRRRSACTRRSPLRYSAGPGRLVWRRSTSLRRNRTPRRAPTRRSGKPQGGVVRDHGVPLRTRTIGVICPRARSAKAAPPAPGRVLYHTRLDRVGALLAASVRSLSFREESGRRRLAPACLLRRDRLAHRTPHWATSTDPAPFNTPRIRPRATSTRAAIGGRSPAAAAQ